MVSPALQTRQMCLIPEVLPTVLVPDQSLSTLVHFDAIILVRCPNRTPNPVTTICIPSMCLSFDSNIRVLMTYDYFLYCFLKQAIDIRGCILDQPKRLLVANLCYFLLDKRVLGLRCGE
jgi:hypothetical protein